MNNKFSERIKELRTEKGWTQSELADKINYKRNSISNWETRGKEPDFDTLILLANLFNVSSDFLLGIKDD